MTAVTPWGPAEPVAVLHASRWRVALIALAGLALTTVGAFMVALHESRVTVVMGWVGLLFFGPCFLAALLQIARPSRLELDAEGFTLAVAMRTPRRYRWSDIAEVFVWRMNNNRFVAWNFRPGARPTAAVYRFNAALGAEACLPPGWPMKAEALAEVMERLRLAAALAESASEAWP